MTRTRMLQVTAVVFSLGLASVAAAHWCSNIFSGPARFVVKPEKTTLYVASGTPAKLRVYLQSNWPYTLFGVAMRGVASGYTITVSPSGQTIHPGQNVSYLFTISGPAGNVSTTTLNLQLDFRDEGWRGSTNKEVDQNPTQASLISGTTSSFGGSPGEQSESLNAGMLAERFPSATLPAGTPFFGRTGYQQLIKWFGYRFCYSSSGGWRCGANDCPTSACAEGTHWSGIEQFEQDCMRAGVELGTRKALLGSNLAAARDGAVNALLGGGSSEHKCLAAVVGGYLWQGQTATSFTTALAASGNSVPAACQAAGLRALGTGSAATCSSGAYYERAACAAAEGLQGNDTAVKNVLMPNSGDGDSSGSYNSLYYAYMLALVTAHRRATPPNQVSYYPDAGAPTGDVGTPPPDVRPPDTRRPDTRPLVDSAPKQDTKPPVDAAPKVDAPKVDAPKVDARKVDARKVDARKVDARKVDAKPTVDSKGVDAVVKQDTLAPDGVVVADTSGPTGDLPLPTELGTADAPPTTEAGPTPKVLDGGCGCAVRGSSEGSAGILLLLATLAGLIFWTRRSR